MFRRAQGLSYLRGFSSEGFSRPKRRYASRILLAGGLTSYTYYMYQNYSDAKEKESSNGVSARQMSMYRLVPVNAMTKLAGHFASLEIPEVLRTPVYGLYSFLFRCNMAEASKPFAEYQTFNEFFTRELITGARKVDKAADLVSPADGRVMAFGRIESPLLLDPKDGSVLAFPEAIKGHTYPLKQLVSQPVYDMLSRAGNGPIHYCTIYLSPGDYHRFHSPAKWTQSTPPTHINGEALSVAPFMMRWVKNLFCLNERAVLGGRWQHGAFAMIPVGATNVSSIRLAEPKNNHFDKGDLVGMFEMGSTVVLLFHAPKDFTWSAQVGDSIKVGEALGTIPRTYRLVYGWF